MKQKTITVSLLDYPALQEYDSVAETIKVAPWDVGEEVILVEKFNTMSGKSKFMAYLHTGKGIPCNMDSSIHYYHRWCGTTNHIAVYGHGVRKITAVKQIGENLKVTVGKDLHPDWE